MMVRRIRCQPSWCHALVGAAPSGLGAHRASRYSAFADVYDFLIGDPAFPALYRAVRRDLARFAPHLRSMADLGCGTGRFLAALTHLPIRLFGVDRSWSILTIAAQRLAGQAVALRRQDIRRLALPQMVDLITCFNQTINYLLAPSDLARAIRAVARNLRRGGLFVFDFIARLADASRGAPVRIDEAIRLPDHVVVFDGVVDPARGSSTIRIRIRSRCRIGWAGGIELHRQRWFPPQEIRRLLRANGFRILDMRPIGEPMHGAWLHVVARRL